MTKPRTVVLTVACVAAYVAVLQWVYSVRISPLFAYAGLTYRPPVRLDYAAAITATLTLALTLPRRIRRPSDFILWMLFTFAVAPCLLISQYNTVLNPGRATRFGLACAACFALIRLATARGLPSLSLPPRARPVGTWLQPALAAFSCANYFLLAATTGIHIQYLTFSNVYSVRSDFIAGASGFPLIGYIVPIQAFVINPLYIAWGISARRRLMLAAGIVGEFLIYASEGQKTIVLAIPGVALTAWALRDGRTFRGAQVVAAVTALAMFCTLLDTLNGNPALTTLFTRRSLVVPGILPAAYASVFAHMPRTYFGEFLPGIGNPYPSDNPAHIVGELFVHNAGTSANVSWLGHGYLSLGYVGMVIESLLIAVLLLAADVAARGLPLSTSCSMFFMPSVALASSSAFTSILTGGVAIALVLAWRMPRGEPSAGEDPGPEHPRRAVHQEREHERLRA